MSSHTCNANISEFLSQPQVGDVMNHSQITLHTLVQENIQQLNKTPKCEAQMYKMFPKVKIRLGTTER